MADTSRSNIIHEPSPIRREEIAIPLVTQLEEVVKGRKVLRVTAIQPQTTYCLGGEHDGARLIVGDGAGAEEVIDFPCDSVDISRVMRHYLGPGGVSGDFARYAGYGQLRDAVEMGG